MIYEKAAMFFREDTTTIANDWWQFLSFWFLRDDVLHIDAVCNEPHGHGVVVNYSHVNKDNETDIATTKDNDKSMDEI